MFPSSVSLWYALWFWEMVAADGRTIKGVNGRGGLDTLGY